MNVCLPSTASRTRFYLRASMSASLPSTQVLPAAHTATLSPVPFRCSHVSFYQQPSSFPILSPPTTTTAASTLRYIRTVSLDSESSVKWFGRLGISHFAPQTLEEREPCMSTFKVFPTKNSQRTDTCRQPVALISGASLGRYCNFKRFVTFMCMET